MARKWRRHSAGYRRDKALDYIHGEKLYLKNWYGRKRVPIGFKYRCDPVPFTGISRDRYCGYLKRPKTTQERKIACGHMAEGIYVRGKRRANTLPEYWDDYVISDRACKNWKHQSRKKKQWM